MITVKTEQEIDKGLEKNDSDNPEEVKKVKECRWERVKAVKNNYPPDLELMKKLPFPPQQRTTSLMASLEKSINEKVSKDPCQDQGIEEPEKNKTEETSPKQENPGSFTIPCKIGDNFFGRALCDLGASINLMPFSLFSWLGFGELNPTSMRVRLADQRIARPRGKVDNILVKVDKFTFLVDFVIVDMDEDPEVPLIFGMPFLATARALIDMDTGELTIRVQNESVIFTAYLNADPKSNTESCMAVKVLETPCEEFEPQICFEAKLKVTLQASSGPMKIEVGPVSEKLGNKVISGEHDVPNNPRLRKPRRRKRSHKAKLFNVKTKQPGGSIKYIEIVTTKPSSAHGPPLKHRGRVFYRIKAVGDPLPP